MILQEKQEVGLIVYMPMACVVSHSKPFEFILCKNYNLVASREANFLNRTLDIIDGSWFRVPPSVPYESSRMLPRR